MKSPNRPTVRKKKKVKRRIHKGRVALALLMLALLCWLISLPFRFCTATHSDDFESAKADSLEAIESPQADEHEQETREAYSLPLITPAEAGHKDADEALRYPQESMERQNVLLRIHAREWELRRAGFPHSADAYIKAVRSRLGNNF